MKLIILKAIKNWMSTAYGTVKWDKTAHAGGLNADNFQERDANISPDRFSQMMNKACELTKKDRDTLNEEFIRYWMTDFAPKVYHFLIQRSANAKQFVLGVFKINNDVCSMFPNKVMSNIDFQSIDESTISAVYPKEQALVDIIAVLRGSAHFFSDKFNITKINNNSVSITFEPGLSA